MTFPIWMHAGFWGFVTGLALVLGAAIGVLAKLPQKLIASIMAFGAGVLISALSLELMDEAYKRGGFAATSIGFLGGSLLFTVANWYLNKRGARRRKNPGHKQETQASVSTSGLAIAVGSLLDGVPESIVVGLSMISGGKVGVVAVSAIFLSNIPEGLSAAAGMKKAGRSYTYIFGLWGGISIFLAFCSILGYSVFSRFSPGVVAGTTAVAAGAILTMLADTMIPEAFESAHDLSGLITVAGFLASFLLSKLGSG